MSNQLSEFQLRLNLRKQSEPTISIQSSACNQTAILLFTLSRQPSNQSTYSCPHPTTFLVPPATQQSRMTRSVKTAPTRSRNSWCLFTLRSILLVMLGKQTAAFSARTQGREAMSTHEMVWGGGGVTVGGVGVGGRKGRGACPVVNFYRFARREMKWN